jgi:hypothetical protein
MLSFASPVRAKLSGTTKESTRALPELAKQSHNIGTLCFHALLSYRRIRGRGLCQKWQNSDKKLNHLKNKTRTTITTKQKEALSCQ